MEDKVILCMEYYIIISDGTDYYYFEILDKEYSLIDGGLFRFKGLEMEEMGKILLLHCLGVCIEESQIENVTDNIVKKYNKANNKQESYTILEYLNAIKERNEVLNGNWWIEFNTDSWK